MLGAQDAGAEGGWLTVGGHTVDDPEPKFGVAAVVGTLTEGAGTVRLR